MNLAPTLAVALLPALLTPESVAGQDERSEPAPPSAAGMILDGGEWRAPTMAEALLALTMEGGEGFLTYTQDGGDMARGILRQTVGSRPAAELDALANALADIILTEGEGEWKAAMALILAAQPDRYYSNDVPHAGSFDALVRVYETLAAEALVGAEVDDPFVALVHKRRDGDMPWDAAIALDSRLGFALRDVHAADRMGRGRDYVLALIERSVRPESCPHWGPADREPCFNPTWSAWCRAAGLLHHVHPPGEERFQRGPDGLLLPPVLVEPSAENYYGPDAEHYVALCLNHW